MIPALSTFMTLPRFFNAESGVQRLVESEVAHIGPYAVNPLSVAGIIEAVRIRYGNDAAAAIKITIH